MRANSYWMCALLNDHTIVHDIDVINFVEDM